MGSPLTATGTATAPGVRVRQYSVRRSLPVQKMVPASSAPPVRSAVHSSTCSPSAASSTVSSAPSAPSAASPGAASASSSVAARNMEMICLRIGIILRYVGQGHYTLVMIVRANVSFSGHGKPWERTSGRRRPSACGITSVYGVHLIPSFLATLFRLPCFVVGIPVAFAIFRLAFVTPTALFQLNVNPGIFIFTPFVYPSGCSFVRTHLSHGSRPMPIAVSIGTGQNVPPLQVGS